MDKFTFGKTPAAVYLYEYLQANKNQIVLKRVGKALTSNRNLLSQIEKANLSGAINAHNVARIINNIRSGFFVDVGDELASNLTTNILIGEMKSLIRKSADIRKIESLQNKLRKKNVENFTNKDGYLIIEKKEDKKVFPMYNLNHMKDQKNSETLTEKWLENMKGKQKKF